MDATDYDKQILRIAAIINHIQYKDGWKIKLVVGGPTEYIQVQFEDICIVTRQRTLQKCRKWQISIHMTDSEVVRTAWKAILAAEEHEAAEQFTFRGVAVYNPHVDVYKLVELHREEGAEALDVR